MKTPILGGDSVSRSKTLADNQMWNLYIEILELHDGKAPGALYGVPGLDFQVTAGIGPIRAGGMSTMAGIDGIAYIVSGTSVYSMDINFALTLLGSLPNPINSPVSMVNNGRQMIIFDGIGGYLVPGGYPLTGGHIDTGGTLYAIGDDIILINTDGTSNATAKVTVTNVAAGVITAFTVAISGAFSPKPSIFTQASTTGSGSGFILTFPTYGAFAGVYTVPLPFVRPITGIFQDGFGLVNQGHTDQMYQSALNDLSIWPELNFTSADATPDDIIALGELHREVWVVKEDNTEIWVDAGTGGFAFQRLEGVFLHVGCVAPFSLVRAGEQLIWVARNSQGDGIIVMTRGYEAIPISTQGIDNEIQNYSTLSDAIAYSYQQGGHTFYVLTFPSANATWTYDVTASAAAQIPLWHRRAAFDNGDQNRHWSNAHVSFNGLALVGDYRNGNIYSFNLENYTDHGMPRKWLRTWRALKDPTLVPVPFSSLQIVMETGITVPSTVKPLCQLRCSDDDGYTWPIVRISSVGNTGQTTFRVKFNRLGSTRRNSGLDRIFELSSSDRFRAAITGAEIE